MWTDWLASSPAPLVLVALGTLGMYLTVLVLARWSGVRSFAQLSTFDIVVTIAIGSLIATTAATKDPPLLQGVTAVTALYVIQLVVSRLRKRFPSVKRTTDNAPIMLMGQGGEMKPVNMRIARVTEDDLRTHLRQANVTDLATVQAVVMEGTGGINVLHSDDGKLAPEAWILRGVRDYTASAHRSSRSTAQ